MSMMRRWIDRQIDIFSAFYTVNNKESLVGLKFGELCYFHQTLFRQNQLDILKILDEFAKISFAKISCAKIIICRFAKL